MADPSARIHYLSDCYRADNRGRVVTDVFHDSVMHRHFLNRADRLLDGSLQRLPVEHNWAVETQKSALLYPREKTLCYAPLLILGQGITIAGRMRRLAAPLFLVPVEIEQAVFAGEERYDVVPDFTNTRINATLLDALLEQESDYPLLDALLESLPLPPFDRSGLHTLAGALKTSLPSLDVTPLHDSEEFWSEQSVRRYCRADNPASAVVPAGFFGLIPNSPDSGGILYELDQLRSPGIQLSAPVMTLLGRMDSTEITTGKALVDKGRMSLAPAVLSQAQERAVRAARSSVLSLLIGPPGTGKSFTLAAIALDLVARDQTVLLATRTPQALDVLQEKVNALLGMPGLVMRGGRKGYRRELRDYLEYLTRGAPGLPTFDEKTVRDNQKLLSRAEKRLRTCECRLKASLTRATGLGDLLVRKEEGGLGMMDSVRWEVVSRWDRCFPPTWGLMEQYRTLTMERVRLLGEQLRISLRRRVDRAVHSHRQDFMAFIRALRARRSSRQESYLDAVDLPILLSALPVWLVDTGGLHRVFPLTDGLFDQVLLDEATQADLATCLPALQRGKRAMVAGDPKQLRHVSFLSRHRQRVLAERHGVSDDEMQTLDYRAISLIDRVEQAVTSGEAVVSLDEHFRSRPPLIGFPNQRFYRGSLKVMTAVPGRPEDNVLTILRVDGTRGRDGVNQAEVDAAVNLVEAVVDTESAAPAASTIGVLSPFRDQTEALRERLEKRFSPDVLQRHAVRIGTPYAFQGEERDTMILSFAVDSESPAASLRYLNREDVFNVSITRARDRQVLLLSFDPSGLGANHLLAEYAAWVGRHPAQPPVSSEMRDRALAELQDALREDGIKCVPAYPLAGMVVDLMAWNENARLALDLVGCPGPLGEAFPLERTRVLQRCGVAVMPIPYHWWRDDPSACQRAIRAILEPDVRP